MRIMEKFIQCEPEYRTYNICRGESIDLLSIAQIIKDIDGRGLSIRVSKDGLNPEYTGDNSRFLNEFGPFEFVHFPDSIRELYDWYQCDSGLDYTSDLFI